MIVLSQVYCFFNANDQKIIIDSDAKNEIDDQYAIAYAVLSEEFKIRAFTVAHFGKKGSMEKSYEENLLVLELLGKQDTYQVLRGADNALSDIRTYDHTHAKGLITVATDIDREMIRRDFFSMLDKAGK